jgi:hypothetical protein
MNVSILAFKAGSELEYFGLSGTILGTTCIFLKKGIMSNIVRNEKLHCWQ